MLFDFTEENPILFSSWALSKNLPNNPANEGSRLHGGCVYVQVVVQESMEEKGEI